MIKDYLENNILLIFLTIVFLFAVTIVIYYFVLNPGKWKVNKIIDKFKTENYSLSYYVAERHVIWNNMRSFFFCLHYALTLLSLFASLMTVYYASNTSNGNGNGEIIIFLALISMCFTIASIFSNPIRTAFMSQHVWRELDCCIAATINDANLSAEEKNTILVEKIVQMEKYIESFER